MSNTFITKNLRRELLSNTQETAKFKGASQYVLDSDLEQIVNVSMAPEMPLLLKGEPGTEDW